VTLQTGDRSFQLETVNLSPFGAKLKLDGPALEPGTQVQLHFEPPEGRPLDVLAIVWRADRDGTAFFFISVASLDFTFPTEPSAVDPAPG